MRYPGWAYGSNVSRSLTIDAERLINKYVETSPGTPKRNPALLDRPSLRRWGYAGPGPIRAIFYQDGRLFVVSGDYLWELFSTQTGVVRGMVRLDGYPATISSNGPGGFQLFITSGRVGYIFDLTANTLQTIADVDFPSPCNMGAFSDGYFIALKSQANEFRISALEDGLTWDGLDVAQSSMSSDLKLSMAISHREVWLFGSKYTEVWSNTGAANFPYAPIPGVFIEHGIAAPFSVVRFDNTLYWLGQDESGSGVIWKANGYTPERISTHAVELVIQNWPRRDDTLAFALQMGGHAWYALYSPHNDTTWIYDVGLNLWFEWAHWDEIHLHFVPLRARCFASAWGGLPLVGDTQTGAIYQCVFPVVGTRYHDELVVLS